MAEYLTNDQSLTSVANAIRTKGGTSAQLVYPAGFVSAINDIQTGGATITDTTDSHGGTIRNIDTENSTTIESLSVTENGTYTAPSGKAYSPVTVNVSGGGGTTKTVTVSLLNPSSPSAFKSFTIYELDSGGAQGKQIGSISSPTGSTTITIDPTAIGIYCELRGKFVALPYADRLIFGMLGGNIGLLSYDTDMPTAVIRYIVAGDGTIDIDGVTWYD